jgi:hypothetical protein
MRKSRFTDEQIIKALKEHAARGDCLFQPRRTVHDEEGRAM